MPDCRDPFQLAQPFAGTANLLGTGSEGTSPLSFFDGLGMKGAWTVTIWDESAIGDTSVFNSWGLQIKVAKPVK